MEFSERNSFSETDINKVNDFVNHLMSNPGVRSESPLIGEGIIVNFIMQNLPQLKVTFKNSQFFPHLEWSQVLELVLDNLYERVSGAVLPVINRFIDNSDFSFLDKLSDSGTVADKFRREKLHEFVQMIFRNRGCRFNMNSSINIFNYEVIEKYTGEIFRRREFLYNELVMVQKTGIDSGEYITFFKIMLLVKNVVFMKLQPDSDNPDARLCINDISRNRKNIQSFTDSAVKFTIPLLPGFPEKLIRLAVKSNFASDMIEDDEPSSKLIFILCGRFQNYKHPAKIDRGAESPDKSWFGIAGKNAEHFGYDRRILDALYLIAGDNNW
ncbi:MAG TPA: hypothetical protein PLY36_09995 [Spirochaetota bacterium]|nr:hypothetical protein [Spirochaetota bacterium]